MHIAEQHLIHRQQIYFPVISFLLNLIFFVIDLLWRAGVFPTVKSLITHSRATSNPDFLEIWMSFRSTRRYNQVCYWIFVFLFTFLKILVLLELIFSYVWKYLARPAMLCQPLMQVCSSYFFNFFHFQPLIFGLL